MTTIIKVTKGDIVRGRQRETENCPIALALRRKFPKTYVGIWYDILRIDNKTYRPTRRMVDFIRDFDNDIPVKPFSFDLDKLKTPE